MSQGFIQNNERNFCSKLLTSVELTRLPEPIPFRNDEPNGLTTTFEQLNKTGPAHH